MCASSAARPSPRAGSRRQRSSLAFTAAAAARSTEPGCVSKKAGPSATPCARLVAAQRLEVGESACGS